MRGARMLGVLVLVGCAPMRPTLEVAVAESAPAAAADPASDPAEEMRRICAEAAACPRPDPTHAVEESICRACRAGVEAACGFEGSVAEGRAALEAGCRGEAPGACARLAGLLAYGCGGPADVARATSMLVALEDFDRLLELYEDDAVLGEAGALPPAVPPIEARASWRADPDEPWVSLDGVPAISDDGRLLAVAGGIETGTDERSLTLRVLRVDDLSEERVYPLCHDTFDTQELEGAALLALHRGFRENAGRADRFLRRRGFRSLTPLSALGVDIGEGAAPTTFHAGVPVLMWARDGTITIRDAGPGSVRFRGIVHAAILAGPPPADELGEPSICETDLELRRAAAWLLPDGRALVESVILPPAGPCGRNAHLGAVALAAAP
ncbi:MAG: hypothetical protein KC619_13535 [Myxococcales bacterium]|nr:hypothetical protein [Myxococcales bacterium]